MIESHIIILAFRDSITPFHYLRGLISAINKKEGTTRYLADLQEIRKAYVQDVTGEYLPTKNIAQLDKEVKDIEENVDKLLENLTIDDLLS